MANRDFTKIERIMKDFSQNIGGSGSGSGGMAMVNTLPEVGREDTLYKLPNGNVYSWSRVVEKELVPVYKPVSEGDVVTIKKDSIKLYGSQTYDKLVGGYVDIALTNTEGEFLDLPILWKFVSHNNGKDGWFISFGFDSPETEVGYNPSQVTWYGDQYDDTYFSYNESWNNIDNIAPDPLQFKITNELIDELNDNDMSLSDLYPFLEVPIDHYETIEHVIFEGYTKLNGSYLIDMNKLGSDTITLDNLYYDAQEIYSNILMGAEVTFLYINDGNTMDIQKIDHVDVYRDAWEGMLDVPQMKLYSSDGTQHLQIVLYSNYLDTLTGQQLIDDFGIWNESGYMGILAILGQPQVTDEQMEELMEIPVKDGKFATMLEGLIYLTSVKKGDQYEIRYTDTTRKNGKDLLLGIVSDLTLNTIASALRGAEVLVSGEPINGSINLTKEYKVSTILELSDGTQITCKFSAVALEDCFQPNPYAPSVVKGKFFNDIIGVVYPEDAQVFVRSANVFNYIGEYLTEQGILDEPLSSGIIVKMFSEELQYRLSFTPGEEGSDRSQIYASWTNSSEKDLGGDWKAFTYNEVWKRIDNIEIYNKLDDTKDYSTSLIATLSDESTIEVPTIMQFWENLFNIVWPA